MTPNPAPLSPSELASLKEKAQRLREERAKKSAASEAYRANPREAAKGHVPAATEFERALQAFNSAVWNPGPEDTVLSLISELERLREALRRVPGFCVHCTKEIPNHAELQERFGPLADFCTQECFDATLAPKPSPEQVTQ